MNDYSYPIYRFDIRWNQLGFENNSTSFNRMFKTNPSEEELINILEKQKNHINEKYEEVEFLDAIYKYEGDETWCLIHFQHVTYNDHLDNEEILESFRNFIGRKETQNIENGHGYKDRYDMSNKNPFYCFMGAEDRFRWEICRCNFCKESGKVTIDH
jgi:hypothetical protein